MKIVIQNLQKKIPINPKKVKESVLKVLQIEKIKKTGQINFFFVTDSKIKKLNLKYRHENYPTDVLTFDMSGKREILADVVISIDTAITHARIFKTSPRFEIYLYIVHGILHLLGYDDRNPKERKIIQERQEYILRKLNACA